VVLEEEITAVGIVGLGLIGGSLARRMQAQVSVVGFDIDRDTRVAAEGEGLAVVGSLDELVAGGIDVVFVATPMPAFGDVFEQLSRRGSGRDFVVTDVGSVKQPVLEMARHACAAGLRYVGGHPMAGTEQSGFQSSGASLFEESTWVLCVEEDTDRRDFVMLARLLAAIGTDVVPLSAAGHDAALGRVSQLPHVVAAAIATLVGEQADRDLLYQLAAGSFRSATRVAGTRPDLTTDMCLANRESLMSALEEFFAIAARFRQDLSGSRPDQVRTFFESAHRRHHDALAAAGRDFAHWRTTKVTFDWEAAPLALRERAELLKVGASGGFVSTIEVNRLARSCTVTGLLPSSDGEKGGSDADAALRRSTRDF
jgi:prephenate dehydrogenase